MFLRLISEYVLNPDGGPRPGKLIRASPVAMAGGTAEGAVLVGSYMPFAWSLPLVDKPRRQ